MATTNERKTTQAADTETLNLLKRQWKAHADQLIRRTHPGGAFTIDDTNRPVVEGLFWWFFNDPRSCYDLHRGLLVKGGTGTGKTTLIHSFREFHRHVSKSFMFESATSIALEYARTGSVDRWLKPHILAIDEIGCEKTVRHYGNELNVIGYLLHERYALWQRYGSLTIATTNLDGEDMETAYGPIIRDRTREMFNHIVLDGPSRRKNTPFPS